MLLEKNKFLNELLNKFLLLYEEIEAIFISDLEGKVIISEERREALLKAIENIPNYFITISKKLMSEKAFKEYGLGYSDTKRFRLLHIKVDDETILTLFLQINTSFDKIIPYALFLTEKISQILQAEADESVQLTMPSFQYESMMFEKYKTQMTQMGFDVGGMYRFKFVIVGDKAVGKTSIVQSFTQNKFSEDYRATIGLNIITHSFNFHDNEINLVVYDVGGQAYFERFRKTYYLGAQAAFVVFDLTNKESFDNVEKWYDELKEYVKKDDIPIILVGNKADLTEERKISYREGIQLADKLSSKELNYISYIETSALKGDNIHKAFETISYLYIVRSREIEEKALKDELVNLVETSLGIKKPLTLAFFTDSPFWRPGLKIMTGIKALGGFDIVQEEEHEISYKYKNGLVIKNYIKDIQDISDCDGIYCVFDAVGRDKIDPNWRDVLTKIIQTAGDKKVILVGIRVADEEDYIDLVNQFKLDEDFEEHLLFFKLGQEFQMDIYDQLNNMLSKISYTI